LLLDTKVEEGFEPGHGDEFFKGDKNPQHTFLSDVT
jgi:hypothetical protein